MKDYLKIKNNEMLDIFYICLSLGFMFSILYQRFSETSNSFPLNFILFTVLFLILFILRNIFVKYVAYRNGFEIKQYVIFFDRYGFRNFDRLSYYINKDKMKFGINNPAGKVKNFRGIPMTLLSIFIYIMTLGILILPFMYNYKIKKIPHKFIGTKQKYDKGALPHMVTDEITKYRYSKALFSGYFFYIIVLFFLKFLYNMFESNFIIWWIFVIFYIAIFSIIPIIGTEGYELFRKGKIGWVSVFLLLILSIINILIFQKLIYIIVFTVIFFLVVFMYIFWRDLI